MWKRPILIHLQLNTSKKKVLFWQTLHFFEDSPTIDNQKEELNVAAEIIAYSKLKYGGPDLDPVEF